MHAAMHAGLVPHNACRPGASQTLARHHALLLPARLVSPRKVTPAVVCAPHLPCPAPDRPVDCLPADRDAAAALCEWQELPSGLQAVLNKAWADRRRLQQDGAGTGPAGAQAGVMGAPALAAASGQAPAMPFGGSAGGLQLQRGVLPAEAGLVGFEQELQPPALLLQSQQPGVPCEPVVVPWSRVQDLMDAGQRLSDAMSPQHKHSHA